MPLPTTWGGGGERGNFERQTPGDVLCALAPGRVISGHGANELEKYWPENITCKWLRECCRHVEAEVISNSSSKLHQTMYQDFSPSLYTQAPQDDNVHGYQTDPTTFTAQASTGGSVALFPTAYWRRTRNLPYSQAGRRLIDYQINRRGTFCIDLRRAMEVDCPPQQMDRCVSYRANKHPSLLSSCGVCQSASRA